MQGANLVSFRVLRTEHQYLLAFYSGIHAFILFGGLDRSDNNTKYFIVSLREQKP